MLESTRRHTPQNDVKCILQDAPYHLPSVCHRLARHVMGVDGSDTCESGGGGEGNGGGGDGDEREP